MSVTFNLKNFDVKKETQKEHTFIVDGLINGGGGAYIRNNTLVWKWMAGLISGGGLKVGFYGSW